jgi:hypothetical protein
VLLLPGALGITTKRAAAVVHLPPGANATATTTDEAATTTMEVRATMVALRLPVRELDLDLDLEPEPELHPGIRRLPASQPILAILDILVTALLLVWELLQVSRLRVLLVSRLLPVFPATSTP